MDITVMNPGPVKVRINKVEYEIPRLLLPEMAVWMQDLTTEHANRATAHYNPEDKARWLMYHFPPMFDVADVAEDVRTPDGVIRLLRRMLPKAKPPVPLELIEEMVQYGDPETMRQLAEQIASASRAAEIIKGKTDSKGDKSNPLPVQRSESGGSPSAGSKSKRKSSPRTPPSEKQK